jgi:hypothetical protein
MKSTKVLGTMRTKLKGMLEQKTKGSSSPEKTNTDVTAE